MSRWLAPDKACVGVDIAGGRSYSARNRDGSFEVASPRDERLLRAAGCFPAALSTTHVRTGGCRACGGRVFHRIGSRRSCADCGEEQ